MQCQLLKHEQMAGSISAAYRLENAGSEETLQPRQAVGDTVSDSTNLAIEPNISRTESGVFNNGADQSVITFFEVSRFCDLTNEFDKLKLS